MNDAVRLMARYSGRFSFVLYLISFYWFTQEFIHNRPLINTKKWTLIFAVMHIIHFGFLAGSIYLNQLPIVPLNVSGGFLAYMLIVVYPFLIAKISTLRVHLLYYFYVGFIMGMTFLSRIRGEFEGASPSGFHYFGIALIFLFFSRAAVVWYRQNKLT